jgi:hypothetical protein
VNLIVVMSKLICHWISVSAPSKQKRRRVFAVGPILNLMSRPRGKDISHESATQPEVAQPRSTTVVWPITTPRGRESPKARSVDENGGHELEMGVTRKKSSKGNSNNRDLVFSLMIHAKQQARGIAIMTWSQGNTSGPQGLQFTTIVEPRMLSI